MRKSTRKKADSGTKREVLLAIVLGAAVAIVPLVVWKFWLEQVWVAHSLPAVHHYWYGLILLGGAAVAHLKRWDRRAKYFLFTTGVIWFVSDFPDFVGCIASIFR